MSNNIIRIGTRDSQLAIWQATWVQNLLKTKSIESELVYIKSEGDIDLKTPLYAMGIQGIFTKALDIALLNNQIDIAVHSMKDVPTQLAFGIVQAAVLPRASYQDILVYKNDINFLNNINSIATIATSSIRRKAQWLHRYPNHHIENLRGNVNTRLKKVEESNWQGAVFAAAGLERINLRPQNSIELNWMLPAPAQGAVIIVCRESDRDLKGKCFLLNDKSTALCTKVERDFLKTLQGGCSTPISALAEVKNDILFLKGNVFSINGKQKFEIEKQSSFEMAENIGVDAANDIIKMGGKNLVEEVLNAKK